MQIPKIKSSQNLIYYLLILIVFAIPKNSLAEELSYYFDGNQSHSISSLNDLNFQPYNKSINRGLLKGTYWLKVKVDSESVVQIKNALITNVKAYKNNIEIPAIPTHNFASFQLQQGTSLIEIKVDKFAHIPIEIYKASEFLKAEQRHNAFNGVFYGFGLMVVLLNLLLYSNFKDRTFLYYLFFLASILLTFAHRDGFISILGVSQNVQPYTEMFFHLSSCFTAVLFASEYLQMKSRYPRFLVVLYLGVFISLLLDVIYLINSDYLFNALSDATIICVFVGIWYISILLAKDHKYAQLFALAYSFIILFGIDFYLAKTFGWFDLGVDQSIIKLGSYFEMLIITLAVVLRMKSLKVENDEMRFEIENKIQEINNLVENKNRQQLAKSFASYNLSKKELNIIKLIEQGKTNKKIAIELSISINTVKYHLKNLYQKLEIKNRKEIQKIIQ